jgi:hypothetical protein
MAVLARADSKLHIYLFFFEIKKTQRNLIKNHYYLASFSSSSRKLGWFTADDNYVT